MKSFKTLLLFLIILCSNNFFGQNSLVDTVLIKYVDEENDTIYLEGGIPSSVQQQVLVGTTVLPYSKNNISSFHSGFNLIDLTLNKNCNEDPRNFSLYPIINSIQKDSNTMVVDVSIVDNCCYNFLGEASVLGNDTLNLIYHGYGGFCSCKCCYRLKYTFDISIENPENTLNFISIKEENGETITQKIPSSIIKN